MVLLSKIGVTIYLQRFCRFFSGGSVVFRVTVARLCRGGLGFGVGRTLGAFGFSLGRFRSVGDGGDGRRTSGAAHRAGRERRDREKERDNNRN